MKHGGGVLSWHGNGCHNGCPRSPSDGFCILQTMHQSSSLLEGVLCMYVQLCPSASAPWEGTAVHILVVNIVVLGGSCLS